MSFIIGLVIGFIIGVALLGIVLGKKASDAVSEFVKNIKR